MSTSPSATPAPTARSGPGCLVVGLLLPVVTLVGVVIGTVLNQPDEEPQERSVTLDEGTIGTTAWRVDAVRDVQGETCIFLYEDGVQLAGGCALVPEDASFGDQTVVFGRAEAEASAVEVVLSNAETVEIDTVEVPEMEGRFYVAVVPGDVDAEKVAPVG